MESPYENTGALPTLATLPSGEDNIFTGMMYRYGGGYRFGDPKSFNRSPTCKKGSVTFTHVSSLREEKSDAILDYEDLRNQDMDRSQNYVAFCAYFEPYEKVEEPLHLKNQSILPFSESFMGPGDIGGPLLSEENNVLLGLSSYVAPTLVSPIHILNLKRNSRIW